MKMTAKQFLMALIISVLLLPISSLANGGDQRVVEGKYLINLSRSPFTPRSGEKVAMIASFFDIQKDKLIADDLVARIRIAKLSGSQERKFIFEQAEVGVKGGVLEFSYLFTESGLHEIFFDFALVSKPEEMFKAPDFLLDIQKPENQPKNNRQNFLWIFAGIAFGLVVGWFLRPPLKTGP